MSNNSLNLLSPCHQQNRFGKCHKSSPSNIDFTMQHICYFLSFWLVLEFKVLGNEFKETYLII